MWMGVPAVSMAALMSLRPLPVMTAQTLSPFLTMPSATARLTPATLAAPLGSPAFQPSPQCPVGWRGDGTGRYPGANPPVHWGQGLKQLGELRCAASVPKANGAADAAPATLGFFTEWLVAGPIPCADPV